MPHIEIAIQQNTAGQWFWRVEVDGKTMEDSAVGYPNIVNCAVDASAKYAFFKKHFKQVALGAAMRVSA